MHRSLRWAVGLCAAVLLLPAACFAQATAFNISTYAGSGTQGFTGDNGLATGADLSAPVAVAVDAAGNVYIADSTNNVVRKVTAATGKIATYAGTAAVPGYTGDGGAATSATLTNPYGLAVDASGNLYIADLGNNVIRKVTSTGTISTVAGNNAQGYTGDGQAIGVELNQPAGVAVDSAGNLYIADTNNNRIRVVTPTAT